MGSDGVPADAPLSGVRVLDLTGYLAGPFATHQLGDLGAQIVKVEAPSGDPARAGVGMTPGAPQTPFMVALHRDRRSVVLDLRAPAGLSTFYQLCAVADVVVENFRPGITGALRVDYPAVRAVNESIVYCSITGYGPDGPASGMSAIDGPVQARAGAFDYTCTDGGPGSTIPMTVADIAGGVGAVQGVLAALVRRQRTGLGCHVEISLLESLLQWTVVADRPLSLAPPVTLVATASDGLAFVVQTPLHFQDRLVELVAKVPGCEAIGHDPRFCDAESRRRFAADYEAALRSAFRRRPRATWLSDMAAARVPAGLVQSVADALEDPQIQHRNATATLDVDGMGPTRVLCSPFVFDGQRRRTTSPPPTLGQHTADVLGEWIGLDAAQVTRLGDQGAFGDAVKA